MSTSVTEDDHAAIEVFVSLTGKRHFVTRHEWGRGTSCSDRFVLGRVIPALRRDVDCKRCLAMEQQGDG